MHHNSGLYVQYGCGLSAPKEWLNFDASPSLWLQSIPLIGGLLTAGRVRFPANAQFGDIVRGLPLPDASCRGIYASHVLEHLALGDFRKALRETYRLLEPGGRFRLIVPDLANLAERYLSQLRAGDVEASSKFMIASCLGTSYRSRGIKGIIVRAFGNSGHLWMWDDVSMKSVLADVGFKTCRSAAFDDCEDQNFALVEAVDRFVDAVVIEALK